MQKHLATLLEDCRRGRLSRREFLTLATGFGISAVSARALIGAKPASAAETPIPGGTLRIQMKVLPQKDPRRWDFNQLANAMRGQLEYLVEADYDGSLYGVLLEGWTIDETATRITLRLRPGITWNDGTPFTAEDVAANFDGWCDRSVAGNSMASRLTSLINPATSRASDGAIEVIDASTVRLNLNTPDVTIMPGLTDYPAAVQRQDLIGSNPLDHGIGTGAFRITEYDPERTVILERDRDRPSWRPAYLDRVEFLDLGPDPAAWLAAAAQNRIDMIYDTAADFVPAFDAIGWKKSAIDTAATVVIRGNQSATIDDRQPYADDRMRRALALAVDNTVLLEIGHAGLGQIGQNHHAAPVHPDHVTLPPIATDIREAQRLVAEAGMMEFEHQLVSLDDEWQRNTADACAAQLRDAGFRVSRRIVAGAEFHENWASYPFSTTNWNGRELAIQVYALAYRSGEAWNETGFSDPEFDSLIETALGIVSNEERQAPIRRMEEILQSRGVIIQPYWRRVFGHCRNGVLNAERHQKDVIRIDLLGYATETLP